MHDLAFQDVLEKLVNCFLKASGGIITNCPEKKKDGWVGRYDDSAVCKLLHGGYLAYRLIHKIIHNLSSKLPFKFYHRLVLYEISCICLKASPNCLQEAVDKLLQHTFRGISTIILIPNQFFLTNWTIFIRRKLFWGHFMIFL